MSLLDNYFSKGMGYVTGSTGNYGGLLDDETRKLADQQAQMAFAAQLLDAGGWSDQRTSLGQAIGRGMGAAQQSRQGSVDQALQAALLKKQMESSQAKQSPFGSVDVSKFTPDSVRTFETSGKYSDLVPVVKEADGLGDYQPGDYTPQSWAKFLKSKDPSVLERYITPRQEYSPSFQSVTRTLPDGSTQYGTFDTRSGKKIWDGEIVPPGKKSETDAAGRERGKITGAREGKADVAYSTFKTGIAGLEDAMSKTETGPIAGRFPAFTAAQQTAEGAEAAMAPVLKQLFRDSGEGTFTDADQAMLMKMLPTRTDHPEARKAKISLIDSIVREKLAISDEGAADSPPPSAPKRVKVDAQGNVVK